MSATLKQQQLQGTACTTCLENYSPVVPARQPRLLSCGHTFCLECLDRLPLQQRCIRYCIHVGVLD